MHYARIVIPWLLLPCTALADEWHQFGRQSSHSCTSAEISGPTFTPAWTYVMDANSEIVSSLAVANGIAVAASRGGQIVALNTEDGEPLWQGTVPGGVAASPAIGAGQIFVPSLQGKLFALGLDTGTVRWQRSLGGHNYGSPLLIAGEGAKRFDSLVMPAGFPGQSLVNVRTSDGVSLWETPPGDIAGLVYSSAARSGTHVIVGMNGGRYQSFDLATGKTDWRYDSGGKVFFSSPLVRDDRAYFFPGDEESRLFAVDVASGAPVTGYPILIADPAAVPSGQLLAQNVAISSPMGGQGLVIVQVRYEYEMAVPNRTSEWYLREYVVGVDPATPAIRWQHLVGVRNTMSRNETPELELCPTPSQFSGAQGAFVVATSSLDPHVRVLDMATGEELWNAALSAATRSSPVFANGQLYVATDTGVVHVFRSDWNKAPAPPKQLLAGSNQTVDGVKPLLTWQGATDPEGAPLSYEVRLDTDGEVLESYLASTTTAPGISSWQLPQPLQMGLDYSFAVRSRDQYGAWSRWSALQHFVSQPTVSPDPMASPVNSPTPLRAATDPATVSVALAPAPDPATPMPSVMLAVTTMPPIATPVPPAQGGVGGGCSMVTRPAGRDGTGLPIVLGVAVFVGSLHRRARAKVRRLK